MEDFSQSSSEDMQLDCRISASNVAEEDTRKKIVVILVGAPGSGKTTFCNDVMKTSIRPWARICQDTIANGKSGTKSQCLKSGVEALKDEKSVFIDRCNLDREQRSEFVKLGGPQVAVHAVVLDLPARLCMSRSVKRTGHEGNLQGGKAAAVVNRMLQKKELPKLSEGFSRITFCQNESDVQGAVNTYSKLGPLDSLPSGCFGQKDVTANVQLGIMKFLKKVDTPDNKRADGNIPQDSVSKEKSMDNDVSCKDPERIVSSVIADHNNKVAEDNRDFPAGSFVGAPLKDVHTLAFPSISTSDCQFNHDKASDIIVEKVGELLNKVEHIRLVMVDLSVGSHMLSLVKAKAAQKNIDCCKFFMVVGDITRLCSEKGLHCNIIANAANWRLKPGGGGVNAAIFSTAGRELEIATKEQAESLKPGKSVVVPLPKSSPLYKREGVTHVIHVLGPNMNPQRPNYLGNDYIKGCQVLREAYTSLFESFASIARTQILPQGSSSGHGLASSELPKELVDENLIGQCLTNDQRGKLQGLYESDRNKKCKGIPPNSGLSEPLNNMMSGCFDAPEGKVHCKKLKYDKDSDKKAWGSWAQALHHISMHPEEHKGTILEMSDEVVVLNDLYPKAKMHLLVLARMDGLDCLADVRREHLLLLRTMHSVGLNWAKRLLVDDVSLIFRLGYHSVPSIRQLHLHVISQDFSSNHLKNKKHWNSFNTDFFRDSVDVIQEIDKQGKARLNDEVLLATELRCHRCKSAHPNIPRLKAHISNCKVPLPAALLLYGHLITATTTTVNKE